MKFKIDENLPVDLKGLLAHHGHDAHTVYDEELEGEPDEAISAACIREDRILLTADLDFADLRRFQPSRFPGIIVLRLPLLDKHSVLKACGSLMEVLKTEEVGARLWIVEESRIRVREN